MTEQELFDKAKKVFDNTTDPFTMICIKGAIEEYRKGNKVILEYMFNN